MSHEIRADRTQLLLLPPSLDEWVASDHPARFVVDLVDSLDLVALGFRQSPGEEGRPHYGASMLLAVWLYGWMDRVRSTRALEKACVRDMAYLWITGNEHPDHNTLWRFFRDNKKPRQQLFKKTVQVAVKAAFAGFLAGKQLTANQIEFVNLVIDHLTEHGVIDKALLYESPFTDVAATGPEELFGPAEMQEMLAVIERVAASAAA